MAQVREILQRKGPQVWTIGRDASVLQGAMLMNEHKIGALVVLDQGQISGMFTERDVLHRVVAQQRDPAHTTVADVMSAEVLCCSLDTSVDEARGAMRDKRIRHLPVVADGLLLGLISIGDLNAYQAAAQEQTIFLLSEYLYGRV
jgi:CBS domain-containing protein